MNSFLDLADLSRDEVRALLDLALRLEAQPEPQALAGKILGLVFFNPSLRTLASFQAGMQRLGGTSFVITPGQGTWQLETRIGETAFRDGIREYLRRFAFANATWPDLIAILGTKSGEPLDAWSHAWVEEPGRSLPGAFPS